MRGSKFIQERIASAAKPVSQETSAYVTGTQLPAWACRWWLRTRKTRDIPAPPGFLKGAEMEVYVPWWAWPLEAMHRVVFGDSRLKPMEEK